MERTGRTESDAGPLRRSGVGLYQGESHSGIEPGRPIGFSRSPEQSGSRLPAYRALFRRGKSDSKGALALSEGNLGREHLKTAIALNNLGQLRLAQGRYAAGDGFLSRAQRVLE